jgi:hypothetical protein
MGTLLLSSYPFLHSTCSVPRPDAISVAFYVPQCYFIASPLTSLTFEVDFGVFRETAAYLLT